MTLVTIATSEVTKQIRTCKYPVNLVLEFLNPDKTHTKKLDPPSKKTSPFRRAEIIAYMICLEGSEYPEHVMFFYPEYSGTAKISEYVRQILSQSVLLSKQKIA